MDYRYHCHIPAEPRPQRAAVQPVPAARLHPAAARRRRGLVGRVRRPRDPRRHPRRPGDLHRRRPAVPERSAAAPTSSPASRTRSTSRPAPRSPSRRSPRSRSRCPARPATWPSSRTSSSPTRSRPAAGARPTSPATTTRSSPRSSQPDLPARRLIVGETYTPSGNWSTYPPHRHKVDNLPAEAAHEEMYYFRVNPARRLRHQPGLHRRGLRGELHRPRPRDADDARGLPHRRQRARLHHVLPVVPRRHAAHPGCARGRRPGWVGPCRRCATWACSDGPRQFPARRPGRAGHRRQPGGQTIATRPGGPSW